MLGRVLVLSASAGAGHLRAAEAIEKAIRLRNLAPEVQHLDVPVLGPFPDTDHADANRCT